MKKTRLFIVSLTVAMVLAGAGCGTSDDPSKGGNNGTDVSVQEESDGTAAEEFDTTQPLNVENDTFSVDEITGWIGLEEADAVELLGAEEEDGAFTTQLFGEDVSVEFTVGDGMVQTVLITFAETDLTSVSNAISEQLGQDGEDTDDTVKWNFEEKVLVLTSAENGCVLEVQ